MALAPKQSVETITISIRFPKDVLDQVDGYCRHLGGASDRSYVIVEATREVLERDKAFQKTRRSAPPRTETPARPPEPAAPRESKEAEASMASAPGAPKDSSDPNPASPKDKKVKAA